VAWWGILVGMMAACGDASHGGSSDAGVDAPLPLFPVAPSAGDFMWPSLQERFRRSDGTTCTGRIAIAVGDQAVCYAGPGGELRCAGAIYTHSYGSSFVATGETGVDEIAISPTFNAADGNNICIHKTDHTMACMGANTPTGTLGTGDTASIASFTAWQVGDVVRMTGWSDTMCALDGTGQVWCAGYGHTPTPATDGATGHYFMFVDSFGMLNVDGTTVFRAADGTVCDVEADGLHCSAPMASMLSGTAGAVVDGAAIQPPGGPAMGDPPVCWLESSGEVRCGVSGISQQMFTAAGPILALAGSFYSDTLCAVANDGSLWCKGTNMHGELGTGSTTAVTTETQILPPGTFDLTCQ